MPYYRGDYYRGDYYRGDPGFPLIAAAVGLGKKFLPGAVKGIAKIAGKAVAALKKPGVAMTVGTAATSAAAGAAVEAARKPVTVSMPPSLAGAVSAGVRPVPGLKGKIQRFLPGGETGYYKRRRMNVTNSKALRRAIRRATGFAKLARKVLSFVDARAPRGRAKFKRARRR